MGGYLFSGLKVLDVGTFIASPVAATMLADFGADVIKIEPPGDGDPLRTLSYIPTTPDADSNYFWDMDGRNKRSVILDLKSEDGMRVLLKLIEQCDVYITNQPFPVRAKLKLNYENIKPLNPSMIYASLSAYGEAGPKKDGKGFDLVAYWANSGLMDLVRSPGAAPSQALPGMGDHPTAVALYASIVTALLHREKTGEGSMAHTSLLANGIWSASSVAQGALVTNDNMQGYDERHAALNHNQMLYLTKDGRFLQFTMAYDVEAMFRVLGIAHLLDDEKFSTLESRALNTTELAEIYLEILLTRTASEWIGDLEENGVVYNLVPTVAEAVRDPQLEINKMIVSPVDDDMDTVKIINHPVKVSTLKQVGPKRAPEYGEHSIQVLKELGYVDEEIERLKQDGVIGIPRVC